MKTYQVDHKIHTLLHNAAGDKGGIDRFEIDEILFKQIGFSMTEGWTKADNFWLASEKIKAKSGLDAINIFRKKLDKIVPVFCLIGQAFTEYRTFSSLVTKSNSNNALFSYYEEVGGNNLMLMPEHIPGIQEILNNKRDFSLFLKYWKDIINTPDWIAKLILYCASLDALTKCLAKVNWEDEKHELRTKILGKTLKEKLFGIKGKSSYGIRHRLVHGEYLEALDKIDLEEIHKSIVKYFNKEIFKRKVISEKVVSPQRNPYKNFRMIHRIIRLKDKRQKELLKLEKDYYQYKDDINKLKYFEFLKPEENNKLVNEF